MSRRIRQANVVNSSIQIRLNDLKNFLLVDGTLKPAAERRLDGPTVVTALVTAFPNDERVYISLA